MKSVAVLILATGLASGASAFADTVAYPVSNSTALVRDPISGTYVELPVVIYEPAYAPPAATYVEPSDVTYAVVTSEAPIVVEAPRRADDDYLINRDVADSLAGDTRLRGHIETQTYRGTVTLGGRVTTPGMADRAERDARSVDGVRDVENLIRPAVGAS